MGRTGAANHLIPINTLGVNSEVIVHNFSYSLKTVKNRNNTIELRVTLGKRDDGKQNQKSFYGHSESEAKEKATVYLQDTYGCVNNSVTSNTVNLYNYKDPLSMIFIEALDNAPVYKRAELLCKWSQTLEKFNPCFTCSVYLTHNESDGPLSCCCSKRYGMTF